MITQSDRDCRNAIYAELNGRVDPVAANMQSDWLDKYLAAHRLAAEKAVLDKAWALAGGMGAISVAKLEAILEQQP